MIIQLLLAQFVEQHTEHQPEQYNVQPNVLLWLFFYSYSLYSYFITNNEPELDGMNLCLHAFVDGKREHP